MSIKVGTICTIVQANRYPELLGEEVEVVGPLAVRKMTDGREVLCYHVQLRSGPTFYDAERKMKVKLCPEPHQIRPKRPPEQDMSWAVSKVQQIINNIPATIS